MMDSNQEMNCSAEIVSDDSSEIGARQDSSTSSPASSVVSADVNLPKDPSDKYYLTHCFVCRTLSKPDQEFIRNYGGVVCFGCRAFWRRAHMKTRNPEFRCKRNGGCDLTVTSQRKCRKCRYDRCVISGMTHEAILTEEQKEVRFRKAIQKRKRQSEPGFSQHENGATNDVVYEPPAPSTSGYEQHISPSLADLEVLVSAASSCLSHIFDAPSSSTEHFPQLDNIPSPKQQKCNKIMSKKAADIIASYKFALEQCNSTAYQELFQFFRQMFHADSSRILTREITMPLLTKMSEEFKTFAFLQRHFVGLCEGDQMKLLNRNTSLYIQLQFASCLLSPDDGSPSLLQFELSGSQTGPFLFKLQSFKHLLRPDADIAYYAKLLWRLNSLWLLDQIDQRALLASILLYEHDSNIVLEKSSELEDVVVMNSLMFEKHVETLDNRLDIQVFVSTITKMAIFCSNNIEMQGELQDLTQQSLTMPYTEAEEQWLNNQYQLYDEAFFSVPLGEATLQEFFSYSLGVPLSKSYFFVYFSAQLERMKQIYKRNSDFEVLSVEAQNEIINCNSKLGLAMLAARSENFATGYDQIMHACNDKDNAWWKKNFSAVFDKGEKIKHCTFKNSKHLNAQQISHYGEIIRKSRHLVLDPPLFRLKVLLALTLPQKGTGKNLLAKTHWAYLTILRRRMLWLHSNEGVTAKVSSERADEMIGSIITGLEGLRLLTGYLQSGLDAGKTNAEAAPSTSVNLD